MSQHRLLRIVLASLLAPAFLPLTLAWRVEITCFLGCESADYYRADGDLITFNMTEVPSSIDSFNMWISQGRTNSSLTRLASMGNRILLTTWYEYIPSNITTGDNYYFEVYENPGGSGGALGPFSVLGANEPTPSSGSGGGGGYPSYNYPSYTYPSYTYPSYTYSSYTYRPTSGSDSDSDEYESQLHALFVGRIVGGVVGSVVGVAIIIGIFFYMRRRQRRLLQEQGQNPQASPYQTNDVGSTTSPPMTHMVAMPVPPGQEPQQPPQPGYYYAMLTPQQPSPGFVQPLPHGNFSDSNSGSFSGHVPENSTPPPGATPHPPNAFLRNGQ
ncbi:hypothetical protein BJV82DRAFT_718038 [Fennellomyces sp. T-0311]|nr:hypothetical protein BJV82DRAFT_718038 [Fennellomyces sp. T-0311]